MDGCGQLLLVEDEAGLRDLVHRFLQLEGYRVLEAPDGLQAARMIAEGVAFMVDLALVDLNLPELNGIEVCRLLRAARPDLPILVCSAAVVPEHDAALRAIGVDQFLTKPYHPEQLLSRIARLTGKAAPSGSPIGYPSIHPLSSRLARTESLAL